MEKDLRERYERMTRYIEEPVREIVPALWDLPYVIDSGFSCSGHILAQAGRGYERFDKQRSWYPHRAILELAFSLDPSFAEERNQLCKELLCVISGSGDLQLRFDDSRISDRKHLPYSRVERPNVYASFNATVPEDIEKSLENVERVVSSLTGFWEEVANVVRRYNPQAKIGSIHGKNFHQVINWAKWQSCFPQEF